MIELNPSVSSDEAISRQYEWSYKGESFRLTLPIPKDIYDYYSSMERAPIEDYSIYVTHPGDDAELVYPLADELKRLAVQKGYDAEETVNFAASFVQNLKYRLEDEEYPNYPVETLFDLWPVRVCFTLEWVWPWEPPGYVQDFHPRQNVRDRISLVHSELAKGTQ